MKTLYLVFGYVSWKKMFTDNNIGAMPVSKNGSIGYCPVFENLIDAKIYADGQPIAEIVIANKE